MKPILPLALLLFALGLPAAVATGDHAEPASTAAAHDGAIASDQGIRSPDLAPGASWSYTFNEAMKFDYHCHPHPWMLAAINVVANLGRAPMNHTVEILEPTGQPFDNWTWSPAVTTIQAGDTVTWVNRGSVVHVVQQTVGEHIAHVGLAGGSAGGATPAADVHGDAGHGSLMDMVPTKGLVWVTLALVGGILIGRRSIRMGTKVAENGNGAPSTPAAAATSAAGEGATAAPSVSSHERRRNKRNRQRP